MTLNLKALGLALVAVLALSAVAASGASAQTKHIFRTSAEGTAHFTTKAENTQTFKGSTEDPKFFSCDNVSAKGTFKDGAKEITATNVEYSGNCVAVEEEEGEVVKEVLAIPEFTECDYLFTNETTGGNKTGGEHAGVHIKCPTGQAVHLKVTALKLNCVTIDEQEVADAVRYNNQVTEGGRKDITIEATAHNITVTTPNTAACPTGTGEPVLHHDGLYTGNVSVTGYKDAAHTEPTNIFKE
jgi:hypothetical protein